MDNNRNNDILNGLLHITNDRQNGFEKVEGKIWEMYSSLHSLYEQMVSQTKIMRNELMTLITQNGGTPDDSPSVAGSLHRVWIDIKNAFMVNGMQISGLEHIVFGENAAIQAYQQALDSGDLNEEARETVENQLFSIKESLSQFQGIVEYAKKG